MSREFVSVADGIKMRDSIKVLNKMLKDRDDKFREQSLLLNNSVQVADRQMIANKIPDLSFGLEQSVKDRKPFATDMFMGSSCAFMALRKDPPDIEYAVKNLGEIMRLSSNMLVSFNASEMCPAGSYKFLDTYYALTRPKAFVPVGTDWEPPATLEINKDAADSAQKTVGMGSLKRAAGQIFTPPPQRPRYGQQQQQQQQQQHQHQHQQHQQQMVP
jgi:hypothetical protein